MSHKKLSIKTEDLLINLENPRFEPVKNQKEALIIMLKKMKPKIKKLAEDIVKNGLDPSKPLRIFKENSGKYSVLDGNRRLTAIKMILNPRIIQTDTNTKSFFQKLKKNIKTDLSKLDCVIFSNKKDANHWIELEHTGENSGKGQVPWDPEQKERFKLQNSGSTREYTKVIDFMTKNDINIKKGKATNTERFVMTAYVKEKIGFDVKEGRFILKKEKTDVINNLEKVANKINRPDFNVGKIYDKHKRKRLIDEILTESQPNRRVRTRRDGKVTREQDIIIDRETLIPEDFKISIPQDKVNLIYNELKELKIKNYRNAVAVLFRVFLELSVNHFIGKRPSIEKKLSQKTKKSPPLYKKIEEVSNYMEEEQILTNNKLKPIRIAISDKHHIFSTHTFNSYVHNLDHIPDSDNLKITWFHMKDFIKKLWE